MPPRVGRSAGQLWGGGLTRPSGRLEWLLGQLPADPDAREAAIVVCARGRLIQPLQEVRTGVARILESLTSRWVQLIEAVRPNAQQTLRIIECLRAVGSPLGAVVVQQARMQPTTPPRHAWSD